MASSVLGQASVSAGKPWPVSRTRIDHAVERADDQEDREDETKNASVNVDQHVAVFE